MLSPTSRSPLFIVLFTLATLLLNVGAQVFTTTLPDGDTIIVSQSTNALGVTLAIQTLSTIPAITTGLGGINTRLTTSSTTSTTNPLLRPTTTTTSPIVATTIPLVETTDTEVAVVPTPTTATTTRRSSSTTLAIVATPTVAPGDVLPVSAGTVQDYSQYQASVNSALATGSNSALDSNNKNAASPRNVGVGAGMIGVGVLVGVVAEVVGW